MLLLYMESFITSSKYSLKIVICIHMHPETGTWSRTGAFPMALEPLDWREYVLYLPEISSLIGTNFLGCDNWVYF